MRIFRETADFVQFIKSKEKIPFLFKAEMCLLIIFEIAVLVLIIALGTIHAYLFLIIGIIFICCKIKRINKACIKKEKNKKSKFFLSFALTLIIFCLIFTGFPPYLHSTAKWKYPVQKVVLNLYSNITVPDYFPKKIPESAEDYHFDYFPSMLQGTGHVSMTFKADSETILEYEEQFSEQAVMSFDLSEYVENEGLFNGTYKDEMIKNGGNEYSNMSFL
ncbi:MAG: hypothetical protein ACI4I6_05180 [Hominimerdicola sp.]